MQVPTASQAGPVPHSYPGTSGPPNSRELMQLGQPHAGRGDGWGLAMHCVHTGVHPETGERLDSTLQRTFKARANPSDQL